MDASGSVGNSITFAKWKGRNYVRRYAIPSNPRTVGQTSIRAAMGLYTSIYKANTATVNAAYGAEAQSLKISPFNAYIRAALKSWKSSVLEFPGGQESGMTLTTSSIALTGVAQQRGITWNWSETHAGTPLAWFLMVKKATDPGLGTANIIFGSATATSYLQTSLEGATVYQGRVGIMFTDFTVRTLDTPVSVTTP